MSDLIRSNLARTCAIPARAGYPTRMGKVEVDQDEYRALCMLRDGAYEDARAKVVLLQSRYDACLAVNREQVIRLTSSELALDEARVRLKVTQDRLAATTAQLAALEPLRSNIPQPALGKAG